MRVLILNQTFYPDVAATAQLMWDLAEHLGQRGHEVWAISSRNIYGTDRQFASSYERHGAVRIHRVGGAAFGKRRLAGRLADIASYYAAALWRMQELPTPDVVLALTSPPFVGALGVLHKQFHRASASRPVRLVQHIMDLYPDAAEAGGVVRRGSLAGRAMERLTARTLQCSDAVIALGQDMRTRILERYLGPGRAARVHVVWPWADGRQLRPHERRDNGLAASVGAGGMFRIVYSGNLGVAHDLETLLGAIRQMRQDARTCWVFIGAGQRFDVLRQQAAAEQWEHVRFLDFQEREGLNDSLNLADVHLVSQLPAFEGVVVPSKLFGTMAVGRPVVMVGPATAECARLIEQHGSGFVVANGAAEQLTARLRQLREDPALRSEMGRRARQAFERLYDRPVACARIAGILEGVVSP